MRSSSRSSGRRPAGPAPAAPAPPAGRLSAPVRALAAAALLAPLLALSACAGGARIDPSRAPSENLAAFELAQALYREGEGLRTFAARGEATYDSGSGDRFFRFEFVCERPGSLLFTAFDPLGSPAFRLAASGGILRAADYMGKAYYAGEIRGGPLELLVPIPLSAEELLATLSGSLPFPPARAEALAPFPAGEGEALFLVWPQGEARPLRVAVSGSAPWTEAAGKTVRSVSLGSASSPDFQARYGRWESAPRDDRGGAPALFPRTVAASWRQGGERALNVTYREVSLGFSPPPGIFNLDQPPGFTYETVMKDPETGRS